jgi:hypothetical protein
MECAPEYTTPAEAGRSVLRLLPLRLVLRSENLALDFFSGPLWRSGFGLALKPHFPLLFERLFGDQSHLGRLYALQVPAVVCPGEAFELGVNLFGAATEQAIACAQALARLGEMGLGEQRGRYRVLGAYVDGNAEAPFFDAEGGITAWPQAQSPQRWLAQSAGAAQVARLHLLTPLRIKEHNTPSLEPPEFSQIVRRLQGRLSQLCQAAGEANPLPREVTQAQIRLAGEIRLQDSVMCRQQVRRRSSRSRQTMEVDGLTGTLVYHGDLAPFAGLLALGEVMQLGGKTAFGFGRIHTTYAAGDAEDPAQSTASLPSRPPQRCGP